MKKLLLIVALFPFLLATQCDEEDNGIACTEEARAGLNITVKDAETNDYGFSLNNIFIIFVL